MWVHHSPGGNSNIVFIMQTTGHPGNGTFLKASTGVRVGENCSCTASTTVQLLSLRYEPDSCQQMLPLCCDVVVFYCLGFVCKHWAYSKMELTTSKARPAVHSLIWKTQKSLSCPHTFGSCFARIKWGAPSFKNNWLHSCYPGSSSGSQETAPGWTNNNPCSMVSSSKSKSAYLFCTYPVMSQLGHSNAGSYLLVSCSGFIFKIFSQSLSIQVTLLLLLQSKKLKNKGLTLWSNFFHTSWNLLYHTLWGYPQEPQPTLTQQSKTPPTLDNQ